MGLDDIPAIVDYILSETNQSSLVYVGHSMGTTISYVLLSAKPEYNEKIKFVISLSPVAYWKHRIKIPLLKLMTKYSSLISVMILLHNVHLK